MTRSTLVRWLCDPAAQEELSGDLEELYAIRVRRLGPTRARLRTGLDLLSVCVRQSRARAWTAKQWATGALLAGCMAATARGPALPVELVTITARDAAGPFTLTLRGHQVIAATVNAIPLPLTRIRQSGSQLTLVGAGTGGDLEIAITPAGGITWEGRSAAVQPQATTMLAFARQHFAEFAEAARREGGKLWGRSLYGPILIVDRATRQVVANEPDSAATLVPNGAVFTGTWPAAENIANTAVRWGGKRWTMIVWPLPSGRYARDRLAFHEMFHRIQPDLGLVLSDPANAHLATRDGRIWTRLEWRALAEALVRRGEERETAIRDALLFRAYRHSLFPNAAAEERALELNEGLAEYTGLTLSGLPPWVLADRAAVELATREQQASLSRSFAYASGPAYGILLDEANAPWRRGISTSTDLAGLLRSTYRLPFENAAPDAEARAARYDGARVMAIETETAERAAAAEARARARLVDGPTVSFLPGDGFRFSFDPNAATPLGDIGTVYESARISDDWGILTVESGGVLMVRSATGITRVVVAAPANPTSPPQAGEGWRLELSPGWRIAPAQRPGSWEVRRAP